MAALSSIFSGNMPRLKVLKGTDDRFDSQHFTHMPPQDGVQPEPDDANNDPGGRENAQKCRPPPPLVAVVDEQKHSLAGLDPLVADAIRQHRQQLELVQLDDEQRRRSRSLRRSSAQRARRWRAVAGFASILPRGIARHLTFYRLHLSYFVLISLLGTICLWIFPKRGAGLAFIDCMYNAVSAACTTGLISVRMRSFSIADDLLLMFFMIIGSTIFTALIPLFYRRFQFLRNIEQLEDTIRRSRPVRRAPPRVHPEKESGGGGGESFHNRKSPNQEQEASRDSDVGNARRQAALDEMRLEADAGEVLIWVICVYFFVWTAAGFFVLETFFLSSPSAMAVLRAAGIHHSFFSLFLSISTFTNSGLLLLDDNMVPLRAHSLLLLWLSFIILIGNTMFAPCLRLIIWALRRVYVRTGRRRVFDFLLDNPRRSFTHLFRRNETLWLVVTVMGFNAFESAAFYVLSWNSTSLDGLNAWQKLVNGMFQSVTTRSAGLNVVAIGGLSAPMLVLYIGMMYIAVYPVYLTRQGSQQQHQDEHTESKASSLFSEEQQGSRISVQSRKLLMRDSAYLFFTIFVLCVVENKRIQSDPLNFSIFNLIFEVISAYGNVGLSVGYSCSLFRQASPERSSSTCVDVPYSFSGTWSVGGKLLMIVIMLLGRNRGLPDNMDMAVQIPRAFEQEEEEDDEQRPPDTCQDALVVDVVVARSRD